MNLQIIRMKNIHSHRRDMFAFVDGRGNKEKHAVGPYTAGVNDFKLAFADMEFEITRNTKNSLRDYVICYLGFNDFFAEPL